MLAGLLLAGMVGLAGAPALHGAEVVVTPGISSSLAHDDNISFAGRADTILRASPGLQVLATGERSSASLSAGLTATDYLKDAEQDRTDENVRLNLLHQATELVGLSLQSSYARASAFAQVLEEEGVVIQESTTNRFALSPGVRFSLTQRDSLSLSYSLNASRYESPQTFDLTTHTLALGYTHALANQQTVLLTDVSYSQSDYDRELDANATEDWTVQFTQGVSHAFSERFSVQASVGAAYRESTSTALGLVVEDGTFIVPGLVSSETDGLIYIFNARTDYRGELWNAGLSASRNLNQSVLGERRVQSELRLNVNRNITEALRVGASGRFTRTDSQDDSESAADTDRRDLVEVRPTANYIIIENLSASLSYARSFFDDKVAGTTENRNLTILELRWDFPIRRVL